MTNKSKRTWHFLYDVFLYPLLNMVSAILLILTVQLTPFTALVKLTISMVIILVLVIETILVTYHLLKKDGLIDKKTSTAK